MNCCSCNSVITNFVFVWMAVMSQLWALFLLLCELALGTFVVRNRLYVSLLSYSVSSYFCYTSLPKEILTLTN